MRFPDACYQIEDAVAAHLPVLRPAQQRGLVLWVYGTILAQSACQNAVITALRAYGRWHTVRQVLREWLADGQDRAAPCHTQVQVAACFGPLLRWLVAWWRGDTLPLAIDATTLGDRLVVLAISVLYRGSAIPVAWTILPAPGRGPWLPQITAMLTALQPAVPPALRVLVMTDRGLWSPVLWDAIVAGGWVPLMRLRGEATVQPVGQRRVPARRLIPGPGHAWIGAAVAFKEVRKRRAGTVIVVWAAGQQDVWVLLTTLAPAAVGPCWYGGRMWIELGFRALKSMGWHWERTQRTEPARVARHWLVLAVATLWTLAAGTWVAEVEGLGLPPTAVYQPPSTRPVWTGHQRESLFRLGWSGLLQRVLSGAPLPRLWLLPTGLPAPPPGLQLTVAGAGTP
jgi:hypothetical protein